MDFTSSATDGISNSLATVDYTASLTATCSYSDGTTGTCALPDGSISYEIDGADQGGNVMSVSSAASNCTGAVEADDRRRLQCHVGHLWGSVALGYLREFMTASVTQTVEVQVVAPVDMASGLTYSTYDNVGPTGLNDCTMASAADWIETTYGTVPSDQDIIDAYWGSRERVQRRSGRWIDTRPALLDGANTGIDNTFLTDVPVDPSDVETNLDDQYVLIASMTLPDGDPYGQTGGGHMWVVVGYSDYGPMIVSWGREFQISWSDFDAWETRDMGMGTAS